MGTGSPTPDLPGFTAGRIGLWRLIKWFCCPVFLFIGVMAVIGGREINERWLGLLMAAIPITCCLVHRKLRQAKPEWLHNEAIGELLREWRFTSNEAVARQRDVDIGRAVKRSPDDVWSDVMAYAQSSRAV